MRNEFDTVAVLRAYIRENLPDHAFLKLDRGDGLFITNVPFSCQQSSDQYRFEVKARGGLTVIYPTAELLLAFESRFDRSIGDLCRSVYRYRGLEVRGAAIVLFSEGLKLTESGTPSAINAYDKRVRQHIAVSMREGTLGGSYAIALINDYLKGAADLGT